METASSIGAKHSFDLHAAVERLRVFLLRHGVLGENVERGKMFTFSHSERIDIVRSVFLLVPRQAVSQDPDMPKIIKPLITQHLSSLGLTPDDELLEILKRVVDQINETDPKTRSHEKLTVGVLRARNRRKYKIIRKRQNNRCKICGIILDTIQEELDHIIPWRIVGDIPDGSNWQLLCHPCNNSKGEFLSAYQLHENWNWVYNSVVSSAHCETDSTRYVVLADCPRCEMCSRTPNEVKLVIVNPTEMGMYLKDHLKVICELCSLVAGG
ncbi:MAG: HNH endonuclease signature motif containing protein [Planctomycetota bacterium]